MTINKKKDAGYIYFMTNEYNTTIYIGVTSDLQKRIYEHKNKVCDGFTKRYNLTKFVYYEKYNSISDAIKREKQIKNFKREWKFDLIKKSNPTMTDLYEWLKCGNSKLNVSTRLIQDKQMIYEIPDVKHSAIAGQARNDENFINNRIKIQCPAKINLTLKVVGKRQDGFHNIESIMQTISLYDYLTISADAAEKFEIMLSGNSTEIPYNEKNLVYKAAMLFIEHTNLTPHKIEIFIDKNIPVAAGLAGGSTDAAGTLYGLNKMFNNRLSKTELHELCAELGSDLNFCLEGGRQMTKGRGEVLQKLPFEKFSLSLIKPKSLGISAKEAYTKFSQKKSTDFQSQYGSKDNFKNDLEWALIDDYKELQNIKDLYPEAVMSGSGSTYFSVNTEFSPADDYWTANNLAATEQGICAAN